MNDDHAPDLWLLAGDYLDGELDAAGLARAEDDPALMAIVAELRSLRSELRTPAAPAPAAREAAISAALASFDELHANGVVRPISAGSRRHTAQRASNRWLGAVAAAVVVLGGLGVVASGMSGNGGDDDAAGDVAGAPEMSQEALDDDATRAVEQAATESASAADAGTAADVAFDAAPTAAPEVMSAAEAGGESASAAESPAATTAAAGYTFVPSEPIADPGQLAQAAAQLQAQADADQLSNTPETRCGTEQQRPYTVLAEGLYRITADTVAAILVAVDDTTMTALAVDPDSCATLVETPLP
jgi:hypothetical protein